MQIYPPFLENMAIAKSKMAEYRQSIGEDDDFKRAINSDMPEGKFH